MGKMGASWEDLPDPLPGKLSHRITRVGPYFSSRSLSNALQGLAQMRVVWGNLRQPSRDSLQKALLQSQSDTMPKTAVSTPSASTATATAAADGTSAGGSASEVYTRPMPLPLPNMRCGLQGMRNKELATAIFSLGSMKAEWSTLSAPLQDEIVQSVAKRSYSRNVHLQDAHVNTGGKMGTTLDYEFTAAHTLVGLSGMNCPADLIPLPLVTATATQLRQLHQLCSCSPLDKHQKSLYLELIKGQIYVDKGNGYFTNSGLLAGVLKADLRAWLHDAVIVSTSQLRESEAEAPEAAAVVEQATEVETDQQQLPPLSEEDVRLQEQKEAWLALIHKRSETVPQNPQHVSVTPAPAPPPTPAAAPALYDPSVAVAALSALADLGGSWQELSLQCKEAVVGLLAQAHKYTEERKHQQPASASSNNSTTNCGVAVAPSKVKGGAFSASLLQELFTAVTRLRQNKMQYIN